MKTIQERNRILNEVKDNCYLAFFDGNPEEGGNEIMIARKKIDFPTSVEGYVRSLNQIDVLGGAIVHRGEGVGFTIEDTVAYTLSDFSIKGDTSQIEYSGKNKMPLDAYDASVSRVANFYTGLPAGTYKISFTLASFTLGTNTSFEINASFRFEDNTAYDPSIITINSSTTTGRKNFTLVVPKDCDVTKQSNVRIGQTFFEAGGRAKITDIQIEAGTTVTDYEPYVGGVPAPNPEYPQDVNVVTGNQTVRIAGRNLWGGFNGVFSKTEQGISWQSNADGTIEASGTSTNISRSMYMADAISTGREHFFPPGTYTLSGGDSKIKLAFQETSEGHTVSHETDGTGSVTFTLNEPMKGYIRAIINARGVTVNETLYPMLEYGSSKHTYEEYEGEIYNLRFGNVELCNIEGYRDVIYKNGGKWFIHKECNKITLNGSENHEFGSQYSAYFVRPSGDNAAYTRNNVSKKYAFCDRYKANNMTTAYSTWGQNSYNNCVAIRSHYSSTGTQKSQIGIKDLDFTSDAAATQKLSEKNATIYYVLDTPREVEITDATLLSDLEALEEAVSYDGSTSFSISVDSNLDCDFLVGVYASTPEEATGVAKYWGIFDAERGGKLLYYFILPYEVRIIKGSSITIKAGNCVLKEG